MHLSPSLEHQPKLVFDPRRGLLYSAGVDGVAAWELTLKRNKDDFSFYYELEKWAKFSTQAAEDETRENESIYDRAGDDTGSASGAGTVAGTSANASTNASSLDVDDGGDSRSATISVEQSARGRRRPRPRPRPRPGGDGLGGLGWVTRLKFDPRSGRLIVLLEQRIDTYDVSEGAYRLLESVGGIQLHDSPLTDAVWHPSSHYYITSCLGGQIKVWTPHHTSTSTAHGKFALAHTFYTSSTDRDDGAKGTNGSLGSVRGGGGAAVTALALHPTDGLFISGSIDAMLRVWSVKSLTQIMCVPANSVSYYQVVGRPCSVRLI